MTSLTRMLFRMMAHMSGQLIAVALVVACGVAALVGLRTTYQSLKKGQADYYREYRFADVFASLKSAPESVAARVRDVPGVALLETRLVFDVNLDVPGLEDPATGRLVSIPDVGPPRLNGIKVQSGQMPAPRSSTGVLISSAFAEANDLHPGDRIGAVLNGRWRSLRVAGLAISPEYVYEIQGGAAILPDNRRFGIVWMRREAIEAAFDREGAFNNLTLTLARGANEADAIAGIDRILEPYGGLGAYGRDDQVAYRFLTDEISQNRVTSTYIPAVFFGVAAFLLNIVLSRLMALQRTQIALLKAFGYSNLTVGLLYLKLALTVVAVGAAIGIAVGLWFGYALMRLYQAYYRFPALTFAPDLPLILSALGISAAAAALGAWQAVHRATVLPPAEAMRPEAPAAFHHSWTEILGFHRLLSPAGRMIYRNLGRKPVKAALNIIGIAMAVAILVIGRWGFDALDLMVHMQFELVQKEDVAVSFENPRSLRALHVVEHLPGVMASEPYRSVSVRLRSGHRKKKVGLLGIEPGSRFRFLVDKDGQAHPLPAEGLVLTTKLAELLDVAIGDPVTVEVLEGARPVRQSIVGGTVDEMLGLSAYMNIRALNRMMRETDAMSGAYLQVDPKHSAELYRDLKETPLVSGVAIQQAMIDSFEKVVAESMNISNNVLVVFSCIIAFGMVYNGARIALSERSAELASLRVLGFSRREVAFILLGEQAVLTAAAIPVGFGIGYWVAHFLSHAMSSEMYRMPAEISPATWWFAFQVVAAASLISGFAVVTKVRHLDLIGVLKTRE